VFASQLSVDSQGNRGPSLRLKRDALFHTKGVVVQTNKRIPRWLIVGGTAALLGLLLGATVLGPGPALAQETTTMGSVPTEDAAEQEARQTERIRASLDALVVDGTISAEQADAVASHLTGRLNLHGRRLHRIHAGLDVAALAIGITERELLEALRDGQSVAEVAATNGVDAQTVIEALVAEVNERVDEAVASGDLDAHRASQIMADAEDRVTDFVNGNLRFRRGRLDVAPAA
jgi:polyhydroxyalkanoate synthesis regulator phasin